MNDVLKSVLAPFPSTSVNETSKKPALNWQEAGDLVKGHDIFVPKLKINLENESNPLKPSSLIRICEDSSYELLRSGAYSKEDIDEKIKSGQKPHWRFKLNDSIIEWNDLIKGKVKFDPKNLSDPILIREDGSLLYHLPSVIDDIEEGITHIIRGEDHISNTAFHIQMFEALNDSIPKFAHHPFLTDQEGKGFGKRLRSLSIENLKAEGYEDVSIINYLINIGSSEDIKPETISDKIVENFDIKNISTSSAKFSEVVLKSLNADILKNYKFEQVSNRINFINSDIDLEKLWIFSHNNIFFIKDIIVWSKIIGEMIDISAHNITEDFIKTAVESIPDEPFNYDSWDIWTKSISEKTGLKGRNLFMPLRLILTGKDKGPELKNFLPLLDKQTLLRKFGKT